MNVFQRSWALTKASFSVIKRKPVLLVFPILYIVVTGILVGLIVVPFVVMDALYGTFNHYNQNDEIYQYLIYFAFLFTCYLIAAVVGTFYNLCIAYIAMDQFVGDGSVGFWAATKFAFGRLNNIIAWGFLAATVGVLLALLRSFARSQRGVARIAAGIASGVARSAWRVATIFVVPVLVLHDVGPIQAIKLSTRALGKAWGESLVRRLSHGLIIFLLILAGIWIEVGLAYLFYYMGLLNQFWVLPTLVLFPLIYFLVLGLVFNVANKVFDMALYLYAEQGVVPPVYQEVEFENAFRRR